MILYQYPQSAAVDRPIPKNKLYEQGSANSKLKQKFIDEVAKITWAYKLSAGSLNIQTDTLFQEVQIFRIVARTADLDLSILKYIDKLIPTPVIFEIVHNDRVKVIAAYKRASQADKSKIVLNKYYSSEWLASDQREPLPLILNLTDLYTHLIEQLLPNITNDVVTDQPAKTPKPPSQHIQPKAIGGNALSTEVSIVAKAELKPTATVSISTTTSIEDKLKHVQQVESLTKQVEQLQKKVKKEPQFNRKVELNMRLHKLKEQLNQLINKAH
ncbi:DUF4391 domain-containing protein [Psychrobacter immobilis]|uniref:DUF4391 domain-containing protein n=1 Tax=Psychrobacter immobilis TaxID=498 RepID=UPI00191AF5D0|nr:DUF4391 domain-containing protein [Psychrobacter immobilis]